MISRKNSTLIDVLCQDGVIRPARCPEGNTDGEVYVEKDNVLQVGFLMPIYNAEEYDPLANVKGPFEFFTEEEFEALDEADEERALANPSGRVDSVTSDETPPDISDIRYQFRVIEGGKNDDVQKS